MKPFEFDRRYGELDRVISAYLGQSADDGVAGAAAETGAEAEETGAEAGETGETGETGEAAEPGEALQAYLRHTWHTRPWAIATAEQQIREYSRNPPGRLRRRLGEFYPVPDVGLPDPEIQPWLVRVADHLRRSIENGEVPPPSRPRTHWEWHARFPELAQLFGGWFSQDMPGEFPDYGSAVRDYVGTTDGQLVARAAGELRELAALGLEEDEYALALAELGMEVSPPAPYTPGAWVARLAELLTPARAVEYGPPSEGAGAS